MSLLVRECYLNYFYLELAKSVNDRHSDGWCLRLASHAEHKKVEGWNLFSHNIPLLIHLIVRSMASDMKIADLDASQGFFKKFPFHTLRFAKYLPGRIKPA